MVCAKKDEKPPEIYRTTGKKILRLFHSARVFLRHNIGHRSTLSFAMCGFPTPQTFDTEPTKKTPPDNLGRRVTHSNFRLVNFRYLPEPFQQRPRITTQVQGRLLLAPPLLRRFWQVLQGQRLQTSPTRYR